jgi:hypothetical protein
VIGTACSIIVRQQAQQTSPQVNLGLRPDPSATPSVLRGFSAERSLP